MAHGFLSKGLREKLEEGDIEYASDRSRILRRYEEAIEEMNLLFKQRDILLPRNNQGGSKDLSSYSTNEDIHLLILNLLSLFPDGNPKGFFDGLTRQEIVLDLCISEFKDHPKIENLEQFREAFLLLDSYWEEDVTNVSENR